MLVTTCNFNHTGDPRQNNKFKDIESVYVKPDGASYGGNEPKSYRLTVAENEPLLS